METGPALSTAPVHRIHVKSEFRDLFSRLDVLYGDQFEEDNPTFTEQGEENFYRGAPPTWLNFHINEREASHGSERLFIKRDGFEKLKEQIQEKRKLPAISTVKLFHQSGSGGTTMAMQVLWDLKKTFRCAILANWISDTTEVAQEVVNLFTAGSLGHQNTVLLLLNDEQILDKLQENIMKTVKERNIVTRMPVAVLLSCVRKDILLQSENVFLKRELSEDEQQKFNEKKKELTKKYGKRILRFHGFNIMQTNFSKEYVNEACQIIRSCSKARRPLKAQLAAFLSLLNAYVPGSYLLESQCLDFLQEKSNAFAHISVEEKMDQLSHLIVTFQEDERTERKVRMAHPLIAKCCTELLANKGVTRSDTARNFLNNYYSYEDPGKYLLRFVKYMLTKREFKTKRDQNSGLEVQGEQERFSRLILDIQQQEDKDQCVSVLMVASNKFSDNPFFPQALARFYCIELKLYDPAEMWAKTAKQRDPKNSFIADTLGQVHKHRLKKEGETSNSQNVLQLAKKAIDAFKHEEQLAEEEHQMDTSGNKAVRFSHLFNCRGKFGFVQVCNLLYDLLVKKNEGWKAVLTKKVSFGSILGDNKLYRFNDLVSNLKGEVQKIAEFFAEYLTFSKLSIERDDPEYISEEIDQCQKKFVGDSPSTEGKLIDPQCEPVLQHYLATTFAGVLACMDREYNEDVLKNITRCWEKMWSKTKSRSDETNFILAYILSRNLGATFANSPEVLIQTFKQGTPPDHDDPPEQHMLALLLSWPTDSEDKDSFDLSQQIQKMGRSYEKAYQKYFRSRYLQPLFFIGKGQDLDRLVHRKVLEQLFLEQSHETDPDCKMKDCKNEYIFKDDKVKERLIRFEGAVRNYSVFLPIGSKQIEIEANLQRSLWKARQVSFFLGFTIKGPVAFDIQTKKVERELRELEGSNPVQPV